MLQVLNNEQLRKMEEKEASVQAAIREGQNEAQAPVISSLASHIRTCWEQAKRAKIEVEQQILKNMRQKKGFYEPDKLAAIKAMKSSEIFMKITDVKCRHAKDWIKDILFQPGTKPWQIEPTPSPEVPSWIEERVKARVLQIRLSTIFQESAATGTPIPVELIPLVIRQELPAILDEVQKEISAEAKVIAAKMETKIHDQLTEGGFYQALADALPDIILHTGFIKGPTYRREKVRKLVADPITGKKRSIVVDEILAQYEKVSPLDIYPAPDSTGINDGYLIEKSSLTGLQLSSLKGVPTFDDNAISLALQQYARGGLKEWTGIETERARLENQDSSVIHDSTKIDCLIFWGEVQGSMLRQWGMSDKEVPDPDSFYPVTAWMIGNYVIKAMLNPDPQGEKNYYKATFDETEGGFWGRGLPQVIDHAQEAANACARHTLNNVGMAAGPMIEINEDRCPGGGGPAPLRVWRVTDDQMASNTPAIRLYNITFVAHQLMEIFDRFARLADEHSGVPAYAHGDAQVGGAGDTASGLSMLMTSAARGIKGVIKTIDERMVEPAVQRQYYLNIEKVENAALVGDFKIKATGSSSLIAKEQQAVRRAEFLRTTQNQIDFGLMGPQVRKYLLKDTARALELDADKAVPEGPPQPPPAGPGLLTPNAPAPGASIPPAIPRTLDAGSMPVAGQDFNTHEGAIPNG